MREKDKRKIRKLLIDALAFLKVEAYTGTSEACEEVRDIIDEASYEDDKDLDNYGDPDHDDLYGKDEEEDEHDSSF